MVVVINLKRKLASLTITTRESILKTPKGEEDEEIKKSASSMHTHECTSIHAENILQSL